MWLKGKVSGLHITKPLLDDVGGEMASLSPSSGACPRKTGATAFVFEEQFYAAALICGSAPATREIAALQPDCTVQTASAVLINGGSAFGLDACAGLMRWQRERNVGVPTGFGVVPICPAVCIFDAAARVADISAAAVSAQDVYEACKSGCQHVVHEMPTGRVGAGAGAAVSKIGVMKGEYAECRGGCAFASRQLHDQLQITVFVVCNAFGDVVDSNGELLTYPGKGTDNAFPRGTAELLKTEPWLTSPLAISSSATNTSIALIFTNGRFERPALLRIAKMAIAGFGRALCPALSSVDGDAILIFTTGEVNQQGLMTELAVGTYAADAIAEAIRRSVSTS